MPIYEYQCPVCFFGFERFFKTISESEEYVPICACGSKMRRVMSLSSFNLKGDGWYSKREPKTHKELE